MTEITNDDHPAMPYLVRAKQIVYRTINESGTLRNASAPAE